MENDEELVLQATDGSAIIGGFLDSAESAAEAGISWSVAAVGAAIGWMSDTTTPPPAPPPGGGGGGGDWPPQDEPPPEGRPGPFDIYLELANQHHYERYGFRSMETLQPQQGEHPNADSFLAADIAGERLYAANKTSKYPMFDTQIDFFGLEVGTRPYNVLTMQFDPPQYNEWAQFLGFPPSPDIGDGDGGGL